MNIQKYRHPVLFYGLATAIPWVLWFTAAILSHQTPVQPWHGTVGGILMVLGLFSPMVIAFYFMLSDPELKHDLFHRVFRFTAAKPVYLVITLLLMPGSILMAQAISLFFGYSTSQFAFADSLSFTYSLFPAWFMLLLAPLIEEMAWHSYGTDTLRARFSLFTTSVLFGLFWALWHFPLSFIKDYYHSNLVETGWLYSMNFYFSLVPFVLIMNWLYYKTGRNIVVAIVFHITAGVFNEIFATHPFSKLIQTVLLIGLAMFLLIRDRDFFFRKDYGEWDTPNNNTLKVQETVQ